MTKLIHIPICGCQIQADAPCTRVTLCRLQAAVEAQREHDEQEIDKLLAENERRKSLLTMCAELVREEANTHDDDCDCDYCEAVAALEQKP